MQKWLDILDGRTYQDNIYQRSTGNNIKKILGKSKITKQQAKPEISYPLVRLPQSEINIAGETAYVFKTEYNGRPLYLISLDEEFNGELKVVQPERT